MAILCHAMKGLANTSKISCFCNIIDGRILLIFCWEKDNCLYLALSFFATVDHKDGDWKSAFDSTFLQIENYELTTFQ